jgi:lysozyme family protein
VPLFDEAFRDLILIEGGYSNDPRDRGGRTKYGITEAVARTFGYAGPMQDMDLPTAKSIYRRAYWDMLRLDEVAVGAGASIAVELFDTAVNMGQLVAGRFLQIALNAFNREGQDWPDMDVDGRIGPGTLFALRSFVRVRGAEGRAVLLRALNGQQCARYLQIAANNPSQEAFVYGWVRARVT